jgi:glutaminyl-tRNA synthetase
MAVLRPLKLVIENYPENDVEWLEAENNPEDPEAGSRQIPFSKHLYIEKDDFMEDPPKKYFRLSPGREIRLKHAYYVTCTGFEKDPATGEITEVRCTYDPATKGGWSDDGRKVKGTSHWVSSSHGVSAEVRLYDRLFSEENPAETPEGGDFTQFLNPDSLETLSGCILEPELKNAAPGERFQFLRMGYFCADRDSAAEKPVFNRTVSLRDTWAKLKNKS